MVATTPAPPPACTVAFLLSSKPIAPACTELTSRARERGMERSSPSSAGRAGRTTSSTWLSSTPRRTEREPLTRQTFKGGLRWHAAATGTSRSGRMARCLENSVPAPARVPARATAARARAASRSLRRRLPGSSQTTSSRTRPAVDASSSSSFSSWSSWPWSSSHPAATLFLPRHNTIPWAPKSQAARQPRP
jgi:hypothetical protein